MESNKTLVTISKNGEQIKLDYQVLKKCVLILRAINHPFRQTMIKLLEEAKQSTVTDIYKKMKLEQSIASQHLAMLRRAGIVSTKRNGKFIYYSVNKDVINNINGLIEQLT